ncbi:MAG: TIM barrel protein [Pedobacter sp.]|uniref:sugar phosphate isomerase/epimerase family protein n=1 Tax=Pedobacter sp. TaxID=1411316 RepID=UPI00339674B6
MEILFFCTRWGSEQLSWDSFSRKVRDAGFDGIESSLPGHPTEQEQMMEGLSKHGLKFIGVHWDTLTPNFSNHKSEMEKRLFALAAANPLFITSHTGKDHFSFEQNVELLTRAEEISLLTGVPVLHETHRGKFSFAAHITRAFLERLPWLKLTLDISHWYTVAESYLQDQHESLELALIHTSHIHSRVGFTQGPQITDPRYHEWQEALQHHLICWDKVVGIQKNEGSQRFTFTSEFGPYPYMASSISANAVSGCQWDLNTYMKDLLKGRYTNILTKDYAG